MAVQRPRLVSAPTHRWNLIWNKARPRTERKSQILRLRHISRPRRSRTNPPPILTGVSPIPPSPCDWEITGFRFLSLRLDLSIIVRDIGLTACASANPDVIGGKPWRYMNRSRAYIGRRSQKNTYGTCTRNTFHLSPFDIFIIAVIRGYRIKTHLRILFARKPGIGRTLTPPSSAEAEGSQAVACDCLLEIITPPEMEPDSGAE
jgi:hypothetical protein